MELHDVAKYARKLRLAIEERGAVALERDDWAVRFRELGFEMDCGHSYEELYGLALYDAQGLRRELERIDDVQTLGMRFSRSAGTLRTGRWGLANESSTGWKSRLDVSRSLPALYSRRSARGAVSVPGCLVFAHHSSSGDRPLW